LPAIKSLSAGALPLYGTCVIRVCVFSLKSSQAKWLDPPMPELAQLYFPGFSSNSFIRSATLFADPVGQRGQLADRWTLLQRL